jgi:hypothetical protein
MNLFMGLAILLALDTSARLSSTDLLAQASMSLKGVSESLVKTLNGAWSMTSGSGAFLALFFLTPAICDMLAVGVDREELIGESMGLVTRPLRVFLLPSLPVLGREAGVLTPTSW